MYGSGIFFFFFFLLHVWQWVCLADMFCQRFFFFTPCMAVGLFGWYVLSTLFFFYSMCGSGFFGWYILSTLFIYFFFYFFFFYSMYGSGFFCWYVLSIQDSSGTVDSEEKKSSGDLCVENSSSESLTVKGLGTLATGMFSIKSLYFSIIYIF